MRAPALVVMLLSGGIARAEPTPEPTPQPALRPGSFTVGISRNDDAELGYLFGLHVAMSPRYALGVELDASYVVHDRPERELYVNRGGLTFLGCVRWSVLAACPVAGLGVAALGVGRMEGAESGTHIGLKPLFVVGARLAAQHHFGGGFGMRVRADLRGALTEARFVVDSMVVWTAPRIEAVLGVDVVLGAP